MEDHDSDSFPGMDVFVLRIALGDDSMTNEYDIADALDKVVLELRTDTEIRPGRLGPGKLILDENGNTVGSWAFHLRANDDKRKEME